MMDGAYQEFMLAQAAYVAPLPNTLDFAEAAPLMCAGLTVYSALRQGTNSPFWICDFRLESRGRARRSLSRRFLSGSVP